METGQFVSLSAAGQQFGVPRQRIAALIRRGELTAHRSPWDRRQRLVSLEDLQRLGPRPEAGTVRKEVAIAS